MSDQQWRIQQLEKQLDKVEKDLRDLQSLRDQLTGMGNFAKWGYRALLISGTYGAIDGVKHVISWLMAPFPKGH